MKKFTKVNENLTMEYAMEMRLERATEKAQEAFWSAVAEEFPDITSEDFDMESTITFNAATLNAVRTWVSGNTIYQD